MNTSQIDVLAVCGAVLGTTSQFHFSFIRFHVLNNQQSSAELSFFTMFSYLAYYALSGTVRPAVCAVSHYCSRASQQC